MDRSSYSVIGVSRRVTSLISRSFPTFAIGGARSLRVIAIVSSSKNWSIESGEKSPICGFK